MKTRHLLNPAQPLRLAVLVCAIAIGGVSMTAGEERLTRPPNVVFILTDNQGAWTLGCYGNPDIRTPHIDQLARRRLQSETAY